MMSKRITLLSHTGEFNDDICEWRRQSADLKTWGNVQFVLSLSANRAEKSNNNHRKKGVHRNGAKHLWCTNSPSRRSPWWNRRHKHDSTGGVIIDTQAGNIGTIQCSLYQLELRGNGTFFTDDCYHERPAGAIKNTCLWKNQPSKIKKEALLLEMWD